ncbi:MFS transporter, partial [Chloroflexota bacterium]
MLSAIKQIKSRGKNIFYGWRVVAAGSFLYGQGIGTIMYGFSAFFNPLMDEFGWPRAAISGIFSISRFEGGLEGLIIGPLIDRYGARKLAFIGITISGLGFFFMLCVTQNILSIYLIFGILISMGY